MVTHSITSSGLVLEPQLAVHTTGLKISFAPPLRPLLKNVLYGLCLPPI